MKGQRPVPYQPGATPQVKCAQRVKIRAESPCYHWQKNGGQKNEEVKNRGAPIARRWRSDRPGAGLARGVEQRPAVRVPRLRGTQADHRTVQMFGFMKLVPPKGGTLTAAGGALPEAWSNDAPLEYRVYAEHRQTTEQCSCLVS